MPLSILHRFVESSSDGELEKVRESLITAFTTIGVVAALLLTMDKTGESIKEEADASEWIDCGQVPCNEIHVVLSWLALIGCAYAVLYTTCTMVWLAVVRTEATRDFFNCFPNVLMHPAQSMMLGSTCWAFDAMWLNTIRHGSSLMLWLATQGFSCSSICYTLLPRCVTLLGTGQTKATVS